MSAAEPLSPAPSLTALCQALAEQLALSLEAQHWWLALPERLCAELSAVPPPEVSPQRLPQSSDRPYLQRQNLWEALSAPMRQELQERSLISGRQLRLPTLLPGKTLQDWAILRLPLQNLPDALLLLELKTATDREILERARQGQTAALLALTLEHAAQAQAVVLHRSHTELLHTLALQLAATADLPQTLDLLAEAALNLTEADVAYLLAHPPEGDGGEAFSLQASRSRLDQPVPGYGDFLASLVQLLLQRPWPLIIDALETHPLRHQLGGPLSTFASLAALPIAHELQQLGFLIIAYLQPHTFRSEERYLLTLLTEQAGTAIENARLRHSLRLRQAEATLLQRLSESVHSSLELNRTLENLGQLLREHFSATVEISLLEGEQLLPAAVFHLPSADESGEQSASLLSIGQEGEKLSVLSLRGRWSEGDKTPITPSGGAASLLKAPLQVNGRQLGMVRLYRSSRYAFSAQEEQLLTLLAPHCAIAIHNAQQHTRLSAEYQRLQEEAAQRTAIAETVAHELHSPLTFLCSYLDLLASGELGAINPDQLKSLHILQEKTRHLERLVDDLMLLESQSNAFLQPTTVNLAQLAADSLELIIPAARLRGMNLELRVPPNFPTIQADPDRVMQALDNLLSNALKYGQVGGRIVVTLLADPVAVTLTVFNQGEAIPPGEYERLFQPYYRGQSQQRGLGLGLAIVRRVAEAHGGQAWMDSEPGVGNTFYLMLPYQPQFTPPDQSAPPIERGTS